MRIVGIVSMLGLLGCQTGTPELRAPECGPDDSSALCELACAAGSASSCTQAGHKLVSGQDRPAHAARAADLYEKACESGETAGCAGLGIAFLEARGRPSDDQRAAALLTRACADGDGLGCAGLGILRRDGRGGLLPDPADAVALWRTACDADHAEACRLAGAALWRGRDVARALDTALVLLRKSCRGGDADGCARLVEAASDPALRAQRSRLLHEACAGEHAGACRLRATEPGADRRGLLERACVLGDGQACTERAGVSTARSDQQDWLARGCQGGDGTGCGELADRYLNGRGVDRSTRKARALYERGCTQGHPQSCFALGELSEGDAARRLFTQACEMGEIPACLALAETDGLAAAEAARLSRRACNAGSGKGCLLLGRALEMGRGVTRNDAAAFASYERGCDLGSGGSCVRLGVLFDLGQGVERSRDRALRLFDEGCRGGIGAGCTYLGAVAVHDGRATQGRSLLEKGCRLGHDEGCKQLKKLERVL